MRYLTFDEAMRLHARVVAQSGGTAGVRNNGLVEAALAQPQMTFGDTELYPTLAEKAAALGFSLLKNHPFLDGNKRIGHAAMETFLVLNGHELQNTGPDEPERVIMTLAASQMERGTFTEWVVSRVVPLNK